jgi:hypothetical protein
VSYTTEFGSISFYLGFVTVAAGVVPGKFDAFGEITVVLETFGTEAAATETCWFLAAP